jgi:hypothetical protein
MKQKCPYMYSSLKVHISSMKNKQRIFDRKLRTTLKILIERVLGRF